MVADCWKTTRELGQSVHHGLSDETRSGTSRLKTCNGFRKQSAAAVGYVYSCTPSWPPTYSDDDDRQVSADCVIAARRVLGGRVNMPGARQTRRVL